MLNGTSGPSDSRPRLVARSLVGWSLAWLLAGALYLLLIDITDLPELLVGAGAATLAATGAELARAQGIAGEGIRLRWLLRLYRPLVRLPHDVVVVSTSALTQLLRPEAHRGQFRAVPFRCADDPRRQSGRHSLAEAFGSFAPNSIIVGIDTERELILGHQLHRTGGREAIDVLELG